MEQLFNKIKELGTSLRPPCGPEALEQAKQKIQAIYAPLPAEYLQFIAKYNGLVAEDITVYYVVDPASTEPTLQSSGPMELLTANAEFHKEGLDDLYIALGECDIGIFVYDSEEKEFVMIDTEGFDEFDGYLSFEDMLLDLIDPEYFDEDEILEDEEDEE